jgi:hypothetical protein
MPTIYNLLMPTVSAGIVTPEAVDVIAEPLLYRNFPALTLSAHGVPPGYVHANKKAGMCTVQSPINVQGLTSFGPVIRQYACLPLRQPVTHFKHALGS